MMAKIKLAGRLCNFAYDLLDEHAAFINENNEAIFFKPGYSGPKNLGEDRGVKKYQNFKYSGCLKWWLSIILERIWSDMGWQLWPSLLLFGGWQLWRNCYNREQSKRMYLPCIWIKRKMRLWFVRTQVRSWSTKHKGSLQKRSMWMRDEIRNIFQILLQWAIIKIKDFWYVLLYNLWWRNGSCYSI